MGKVHAGAMKKALILCILFHILLCCLFQIRPIYAENYSAQNNEKEVILLMMNGAFFEKHGKVYYEILTETETRLNSQIDDLAFRALILNEHESKTAANYYLKYCLRPWGGFEEVIKKRNLSENQLAIIFEARILLEEDRRGFEFRLYRYRNSPETSERFTFLGGKRYLGSIYHKNKIISMIANSAQSIIQKEYTKSVRHESNDGTAREPGIRFYRSLGRAD